MTELDELRQVIDESHRMIIDEDTGRRWKELYKEAQKQIAKLTEQRRVGAEAIMELFGIADIINSFPEAPRSDGREGALGRRVEGLIREQRQQLADANEMIANLHRALAEAKDARDGWKDEHDRAVDQLIDEKRISDRLVDRLSTLEAELTEAQNTIPQMREALEQVQKLKETLRFYGDQHNWPLYLQIDRPLMPVEQDRGAIARRALDLKEGEIE